MEAAPEHVKQKLQRLFSEAAELAVEAEAAGWGGKTPHYSQIEEAAHRLARQMSCRMQERLMREVAAQRPPTDACPGCGGTCELTPLRRTVQSLDGPVELLEWKGSCPRCRRDFFPSAGSLGLGQPGVDAGAGAADRLCGGRDALG